MILPTRPHTPSSKDLSDPQKAADYQQAMSDYNFAVQTLRHVQDEDESTRSNMEKGKHDSLMAIINNMK